MEVELRELRWVPRWTSLLGCLEGCLRFLGREAEPAWLYGATGHAFVINIHRRDLCPSGPTAWDPTGLYELGRKLGFTTEAVFATLNQPHFAAKRVQAWHRAQRALKAGKPCIGWELQVPEYYIIHGYDELGYHYSGPLAEEGAGPKAWGELGDSEIGVLNLMIVELNKPAPERELIHTALAFALRFAAEVNPYIFEAYAAGPAAYEVWRNHLASGEPDPHGTAYNAQVWAECRGFAPAFLRAAANRLPALAGELEKAAREYDKVAAELGRVAELFPFHDDQEANARDRRLLDEAVACLERARTAEITGLARLEQLEVVLR
jgi:hypothetical protein